MSFFQTSKDEQIIDNDKRNQEWQIANASLPVFDLPKDEKCQFSSPPTICWNF